jgi:uncharacterized protein (DUF1697 family)
MPRYVAFLRGVSPMNAKMSELKACFERAGFTEVKTVLATGNVVFNARAASEAALERKAEQAMQKELGRTFYTIVRSTGSLQELLKGDPYTPFRIPAEAKRVVTFLRDVPTNLPKLPIERDGARVLTLQGRELYTAYVPNPSGPIFMELITKNFGTHVTTRTWDTLKKCAAA